MFFKQRSIIPPVPSVLVLFLLVFLLATLNPGLHCIFSPAGIGNQVGGTSTIKNSSTQETLWSWKILVRPLCCYGESLIFEDECAVAAKNKASIAGVR